MTIVYDDGDGVDDLYVDDDKIWIEIVVRTWGCWRRV